MVSSKYNQMWVVFSLKDEVWTSINYSFNVTGLNKYNFRKHSFSDEWLIERSEFGII